MLAARGSVTGVDIDAEAVERASSRTDGTFIQSSVPPIPLDSGVFDSVVSFETIEHIEPDAELISEFARVLKPGGDLIISSPNRAVTSPDGEIGNQFHVREYTLKELQDLVIERGFGGCPDPR